MWGGFYCEIHWTKNPACKRTQRRSLCTEKVSVVFVQFFSRLKQEGEPVDRWEEPESWGRAQRTSLWGETHCRRGGEEDGTEKMEPTRGKAKRRTRKIKMYIRDLTEAERDEGIKSIYLLFFCFPRVHFMSYSPKVFCRCFSSPPTQVIFSFSVFFFLFLLLLFCFPVCNNIREKKKKNIYSAVEIMKTDVMNLL